VKGVTSKKKHCPSLRNPQIVGNMSSLIAFQTPLVHFTFLPSILYEEKAKPNEHSVEKYDDYNQNDY
jgi:hypothetical protein